MEIAKAEQIWTVVLDDRRREVPSRARATTRRWRSTARSRSRSPRPGERRDRTLLRRLRRARRRHDGRVLRAGLAVQRPRVRRADRGRGGRHVADAHGSRRGSRDRAARARGGRRPRQRRSGSRGTRSPRPGGTWSTTSARRSGSRPTAASQSTTTRSRSRRGRGRRSGRPGSPSGGRRSCAGRCAGGRASSSRRTARGGDARPEAATTRHGRTAPVRSTAPRVEVLAMPLRRLALLLPLLALLVGGGAGAGPTVTLGIGEQQPGMFTDPTGRRWDPARALPHAVGRAGAQARAGAADAWVEAGRAAGAQMTISFTHSHRARRDPREFPTRRQFRSAFAAFRERYPDVRDWIMWNEANHPSSLSAHRPRKVAMLFDVASRACPGCRIVGADVLDISGMEQWIHKFTRAARRARGTGACTTTSTRSTAAAPGRAGCSRSRAGRSGSPRPAAGSCGASTSAAALLSELRSSRATRSRRPGTRSSSPASAAACSASTSTTGRRRSSRRRGTPG